MPTAPAAAPLSTAAPRRHRAAEARGRAMGRPLRAIAGVAEVDEELMERIGAAYLTADRLGADVAEAMRARVGDPARVTRAAIRDALEHGVDDATPPALRTLVATASIDPPWLDRALLAEGARVSRTWGRAAGDVLLQLALIGGYRFGGPTDLLVATGALTGDRTRQRLAETQSWAAGLSDPGALDVGGEAWRATLHVRVMHALVNREMRGRWDVEQWGLPINDADQAATLGLFDGVQLLGVRALGVPVGREESRAVMHLWRYVGWLMGVCEEFLVETERERHRLNYHVLLSQAGPGEAGALLSRSIVDAQRHLDYGLPGPLAAVRGAYERERLLGMLTLFLGPQSMRELGLPRRPPWGTALALGRNLVAHRVVARLPGGRSLVEAAARREVDVLLRRYGGAGHARTPVAPLPPVDARPAPPNG